MTTTDAPLMRSRNSCLYAGVIIFAPCGAFCVSGRSLRAHDARLRRIWIVARPIVFTPYATPPHLPIDRRACPPSRACAASLGTDFAEVLHLEAQDTGANQRKMKNPYFTQRRRTHTFVKAWTKGSSRGEPAPPTVVYRPDQLATSSPNSAIREPTNPGSGLSYGPEPSPNQSAEVDAHLQSTTQRFVLRLTTVIRGFSELFRKTGANHRNTQSYRPS